LRAWFVICEDPQRRLEAREIATLAHQASLVQHVLQEPSLARVMIADEVGLGKTVEAGLILQEALRREPGLRVLYLAPARLVANVDREFKRLGLEFRCFVSGQENSATLNDRRIIASIHKAVHPANFEKFSKGPAWDVVVVDECHHLSDWEKGGGSPVRKYKLVEQLVAKVPANGRVLLLSGTPHQGHPARFENLLKFLRRGDEPVQAASGRVIYRTKDDVKDWDGKPLFPGRRVNPPLVVDLGASHRTWLERILEFFEPDAHADEDGRKRAAGWRAGQALQWATSSVEAGLGYLARQGLRLGWDSNHPGLRATLEALRPYRNGSPDEAPEALFQRMSKEIQRQHAEEDIEDIEEENEEEEGQTQRWRPNEVLLEELLVDGVRLLRSAGTAKWDLLKEQILAATGNEKLVLFAQPIETVTSLARYLERLDGRKPAVIIGGQSADERQKEIDSFWNPSGPRFLVSSRAGGEGINLQVAHRLVHLDVPWNPMELEQRVGRVHRFLTRRTVVVDTMVVKDSREVHAYRVAREKLREVASTLVPPDKFESLFSRVMALVPPEELQGILAQSAHGPLDDEERRQLSALVTDGFARWQDFNRNFSAQQRAVRALDPGQARWSDVRDFAKEKLGAKPTEGYRALRFEQRGAEVVESPEDADVIQIGREVFACGDYGGMPVIDADGRRASQLGINVMQVAESLRSAAIPVDATGACVVKWPADQGPLPGSSGRTGVLVAVRQGIRVSEGGAEEGEAELRVFLIGAGSLPQEVYGEDKGRLIRGLVRGRPTALLNTDDTLVGKIEKGEREVCERLRVPSDQERSAGIRWAVTPLLAAVVVAG
jgi:superfamily II DNA or RNA helicase